MTLRVPTHKASEIGMRSLSSPEVIEKAMTTLKGKAGLRERCGRVEHKNMSKR